MRVLVLGGTGYLGHRVVKVAANRGYEVVAVSRGIMNKFDLSPKAKHVTLDRNDRGQMKRLADEFSFDAILDVSPYNAEHVNIVAETFGASIRKYVCTSSMAVYGIPKYYPTDEDHPRNPFKPWLGKVEAEDAAFQYGETYDIAATVVRAPYIIGEGATLIDVWGSLRPGFIQRIIDNKPIAIPDNGLKLFQMGYVEDVAEAFCLIIESEVAGGEAYNIGLQQSITYDRYLEILGVLLSRTPITAHIPSTYLTEIYGPDKNKMSLGTFNTYWVRHVCCDVSKAMNELNFSPRVGIKEGLARTVDWMAKEGLINLTEDIVLHPSV